MRTKAESLIRMGKVFRNPYDDVELDAMLELLDDITDEELDIACTQASKASKFCPTVAELCEIVMDHRAQRPVPIAPPRKSMRDEDYQDAIRRDRQDMSMNEEEYEAFKKEYEVEHGEPWVTSYFHPHHWNEDGTQKGIEVDGTEPKV